MIKVDWLAASVPLDAALVIFLYCWRTICKFLQPIGSKRYCRRNLQYQTLRSNRKPGNIDLIHATNIISQTRFALNGRNTIIAL
jgi:hypothetical protein